jgi:solute:Na+ symporter, SSS family
MNNFLSTIDLVIIFASIALVIFVGTWVGRRRTDTAQGYFLANHSMPWFVVGSAFIASGISSEQMIGTVGATYKYGLGIANWEWFTWPAYTLPLILFIPIYLKNRVTTVPGFMASRFGPAVGTIYSCILLFVYAFVYLVTVLYSGSLAFSKITGWNLHVVIFLVAIIVGGYSIRGGLVSVMWTDLIQCALLTLGGVVLFWAAMSRLPGGIFGAWHSMEVATPERMHLYRPPSDPIAPLLGMFCAVFGSFSFYQAGNQTLIQRMLAARSTWDGLMGMVMAGLLSLIRPMITCFLGLAVYQWIEVMHNAPPLADKDLAFTFALKNMAPTWGVRGVVVAGLIAAVMSTMSGLTNSVATLFTTDLYVKFINKNASEHRMVMVGQTSAFIALMIAATLAPVVGMLGGIFQFFQTALTYIACPFMATFLMGILWKRVNYAAGVFGLTCGLVIQVIIAILFNDGAWLPDWIHNMPKLHFLDISLVAQIGVVLGIVLVTLLSPILMGLLWKRVNYATGILGVACGLVIQAIAGLLFKGAVPGLPTLHFFYIGFIAQIVIVIGIMIVTLLTDPPNPEKIKDLIWNVNMLQNYDDGKPRPWYQQIKVWWTVFLVGDALIYWRFW